jgi:hypothetical protein
MRLLGAVKEKMNRGLPSVSDPGPDEGVRRVEEEVGATRFERATSCSQSRRSSQAELRPELLLSIAHPRRYENATKTAKTELDRENGVVYDLAPCLATSTGSWASGRAMLLPVSAAA